MPHVQLPSVNNGYELIVYDGDGQERTVDPDERMSLRVLGAAGDAAISDVFVVSLGWKESLSAAIEQYNAFFETMLRTDRDTTARPGFRALLVALHWPSQPWDDEEFAATAARKSATIEARVDAYAARIADTPAARRALRTVLTAVHRQLFSVELPSDLLSAYRILDQETGLESAGEGAACGSDREPFDPEQRFQAARLRPTIARQETDVVDALLSPLRQLSFWKMKDRGRRVGECSVHALLQSLSSVRDDLRIHLIGHSFGCILLSAAVAGPGGASGLPRPIRSMLLIQGALSLWSYCEDIPYRRGRSGYFRPIIANTRVAGPIVTTRSCFDTAVGRWYPLAAGAARQVTFESGELPRHGASGTFGLRGPGLEVVDMAMKPVDQRYHFSANRIFNLESSHVIRNGTGASGAHGDILHPEIAHAAWSAALT